MDLNIPGVISIVKNKVAHDGRKGVNNAIIEGNFLAQTKVCIFTAPYFDGVTLRLEFPNQDELQINLDDKQLQVLSDLLLPYVTAKK
jgi:hypothetical protein